MSKHNYFKMSPEINLGTRLAGNPSGSKAFKMIVDTEKLGPQKKMVEGIAKKHGAFKMDDVRDDNMRMTPNTMKMSAMYQTTQKPKTFDVSEKDLNFVERFFNNLSTTNFNLGGPGQRKGSVLNYKRRFGGPRGSVNYLGETQTGFNFFPPAEEDKIKGPIVPSTFGVRDSRTGEALTIGDDSIFFDTNQDGTMLGRLIQKGVEAYNKKMGKK